MVTGQADSTLGRLYGAQANRLTDEKWRTTALLDRLAATFPEDGEVEIFSSPGRTEIGGNHTDRNGGRVLATAVDLDILLENFLKPMRSVFGIQACQALQIRPVGATVVKF